MKIKRRNRHGAEVPTHSLNDIMFFLLLFFLIISTLSSPNTIKVENPESDSSAQNTEKTKELTVTENKEYFFENKPIKSEELDARFKEVSELEKETGVSITIDRKLKVSDIVEVINTARKYKLRLFLKTTKKYS